MSTLPKNYKHLFFDLDRTLWDFETNSHLTLTQLYHDHNLSDLGIASCEQFITTYKEINLECWDQYQRGKMTKEVLRNERFRRTLACYSTRHEELAEQLANLYISRSPAQKALLPNARETLDYLSGKYELHIITNGFDEVQHLKIASSGLEGYFKNIITSETAGCQKPDPAVFEFALKCSQARARECLMIGDDLVADIKGAQMASIDQVLFNPAGLQHSEKPTYEISNLQKLQTIL